VSIGPSLFECWRGDELLEMLAMVVVGCSGDGCDDVL